MGFDFEGILGTAGAGLAEAYEDTVADVIYFDKPIEGLEGGLLVKTDAETSNR